MYIQFPSHKLTKDGAVGLAVELQLITLKDDNTSNLELLQSVYEGNAFSKKIKSFRCWEITVTLFDQISKLSFMYFADATDAYSEHCQSSKMERFA